MQCFATATLSIVTAAAVGVVLLTPTASSARTWYVHPQGTGDARTIAAALDSCAVGDDVLLAPGTYYEHDLLLPAGIRIHSVAGRDATIIDGEGLGPVLKGSNLNVQTTIEGITVRNGYQLDAGGGLSSSNALIVIRDCRFQENRTDRWGGGVYSEWLGYGITSVTNTIFDGNHAQNGGGGLAIQYLPVVASGGKKDGGPWQSPIEISDCQFTGNSAGEGGGTYFFFVSVTVSGSSFEDNVCTGGGGGLFLVPWGDLLVTNSTFRDNQAGGDGGAMFLYHVAGFEIPEISRVHGCLVEGNSARRGGGIYAFSTVGYELPLTLESTTLAGNTATQGGGVFSEFADITLEHCIIAFNAQHGLYPQYVGPPPPVSCCNVFGNTGGNYANGMPDPTGTNGNLSVDPLFCGPTIGDYHLDAASPCLDAPGCGLMGALGQGCDGTTTSVKEGTTEAASWGRVKASF